MTPETRLKKIQKFIGRMPSLSTTVTKVLEICHGPSASANDLNRVISYDPVLTGQLLKLINSAYYGLPNRITTLTRAIIMLGINTVKNLVLATSVLGGCKGLRGSRRMSINDFWAHSLCVGVLSKLIALDDQISTNEKEAYFVAGLLHDLGKLPMMACFPGLYDKVLVDLNRKPIEIIESETMHIGFNHCQAGVLIAAKWRLGAAIENAISGHHGIEQEVANTAGFVSRIAFADHLANYYKSGAGDEEMLKQPYLQNQTKKLGLSTSTLIGLKSKMDIEIEKAKIFLQIVA